MRVKTVALVLAALAALPAAGRPGGPPRAGAADRAPFPCYTQAWQGAFEVSAPRFDRAAGSITWRLRATKRVKPPRYEAEITDGDDVPRAVIAVTLDPEREE
jgi:hypothetical protein